MLVTSVTTKLFIRVILKDTLNQNMKVSSMFVISVTNILHSKAILKHTLNQNMKV